MDEQSNWPPSAKSRRGLPCFNCAYGAVHCYDTLDTEEDYRGWLPCIACQRAGLHCHAIPDNREVEAIVIDLYALFHPYCSLTPRPAPFKFHSIAEYAAYLRSVLKKHRDWEGPPAPVVRNGSLPRSEGDTTEEYASEGHTTEGDKTEKVNTQGNEGQEGEIQGGVSKEPVSKNSVVKEAVTKNPLSNETINKEPPTTEASTTEPLSDMAVTKEAVSEAAATPKENTQQLTRKRTAESDLPHDQDGRQSKKVAFAEPHGATGTQLPQRADVGWPRRCPRCGTAFYYKENFDHHMGLLAPPGQGWGDLSKPNEPRCRGGGVPEAHAPPGQPPLDGRILATHFPVSTPAALDRWARGFEPVTTDPESIVVRDVESRRAQFREVLSDARVRFLDVIRGLEAGVDMLFR